MSLYEIHISVNLADADDEIKWIWFCKDKNYKSIRVLNQIGKNDVQNMISKYCNRQTNSAAIEHAEEIAAEMRSTGFNVIRVKVEAMMMDEKIAKIELRGDPSVYFEIHFKIAIRSLADYEKLIKIPREPGEGISISERGEGKFPIYTIRRHNGNREQIILRKDQIIANLKSAGFHIYDKIQMELSIYDTFPAEDEGWL